MSSKIFNTDLGDGFKRTLKPNKDTIFVDYTTIEIYGNYNLEIEVIGTPTNPIIVESVQFDGFNETNPDYATKTTISGEGTTTITTASTDNYLRISSDGLVVGDVQINLILKKKNSVTYDESLYQGAWDATTGLVSLPTPSVDNVGFWYNVSVADGIYNVGDKIRSDGSTWVRDAFVQIQSDFNVTDSNEPTYIKNKPVVGDGGLTEKNYTDALDYILKNKRITMDTFVGKGVIISGALVSSNNWNYTRVYNLKVGSTVDYSLYGVSSAQIVAFFDETNTIITYANGAGGVDDLDTSSIIVPSNTYYAVFSTYTTHTDTSICYYVESLYNGDYVGKTITVDASQSTNADNYLFSTLTACTDYLFENDTIVIKEGVYEVTRFILPEGCIMKGIGDVVIFMEQANNSTTDQLTYNSTIDVKTNYELYNLTITCKNGRYPIHADYSKGNGVQIVKNCNFVHYGNIGAYQYRVDNATGTENDVFRACSAWGGGTASGDNLLIENCLFNSKIRGFSIHNNANFNAMYGASTVTLRNCEFKSHGIDRDGSDLDFTVPIFVQNIASNTADKIIIDNCVGGNFIVLDGALTHDIHADYENTYIIYNKAGGGLSMDDSISTADNTKFVHNPKEMKTYKNLGTVDITMGQAVKYNKFGIELFTSSHSASDFAGIALSDCIVGDSVIVQESGKQLRIHFSGLDSTVITEGDNIYVDNNGDFNKVSGVKVSTALDNQNISI